MALAPADDGLGFAAEEAGVRFLRLGADGTDSGVGDHWRVGVSTDGVDLVWSGAGYGVAWSSTLDGYPEVFFARICS